MGRNPPNFVLDGRVQFMHSYRILNIDSELAKTPGYTIITPPLTLSNSKICCSYVFTI
jgi:hypothetical protein